MILDAFSHLTEAVRQGGTAVPNHGSMAPEHPMWVQFARDMAGMAGLLAEVVARTLGAQAGESWNVLDIAAGHGLYGIALARHNPNARVTAVDWSNVLQVARENARKAGVAERYRTMVPKSITYRHRR